MSIHIPFQYFISTVSMRSATGQTHELLWVREPWAPAGFSSHIISLLAVGRSGPVELRSYSCQAQGVSWLFVTKALNWGPLGDGIYSSS